MQRLIVMRHAKSSWADPGQRDFDRPLNKRGERSAGAVGAWLRDRGYVPGHALVSSARRTRDTWAGVAAEVGGTSPVVFVPDSYEAAVETVLEVLRHYGKAECVLMLGHQPGIGGFAERILSTAPSDPDFATYPTTATTVIDFDGTDWGSVGWHDGRLRDFVVPRRLE